MYFFVSVCAFISVLSFLRLWSRSSAVVLLALLRLLHGFVTPGFLVLVILCGAVTVILVLPAVLLALFALVLVAAQAHTLKATFSIATDGVPSALFQFEHVDVKGGLHVLNWNSPLHRTFHGDFLHIVDTQTGAVLPFEGAGARFSKTPAATSYVLINERSQFEVSFKRDYPLVPGHTYLVTPTLVFADALTQLSPRAADAFSPVVVNITSAPVLWLYNPRSVQERDVVPLLPAVEEDAGLKIIYCSQSEISMIHEGWAEAVNQIAAGKASVEVNSPRGGPLYATWFGAVTDARLARARQVISTTHLWFGYENATVDCQGSECQSDVYAYVYPNDRTQTVYLCGVYWEVPVYEQGNTFVHEIAHFNYIGRTNDYAYGQTACKNLARSNPARAVENSDNYSYFCEQANGDRKKK